MPITYTVWIDRNRDGLQTSDEIITPHVIDLKWRLGMAQPYDTIAPPGWAEIVVDARTSAYTGANGAALMGQCVIILSNDGTTTRTHFVGYIDAVRPAPGSYGSRTALLIAHTRDAVLTEHIPTFVPAPVSEARALIVAALERSGMPYRIKSGYLVLDDPATITGSRLFASVEQFTGGTGLTPLAYGGVWDSSTPNARAFIAEVVASERGRFFCGRDGTLHFYNRHVLLQTLTSQATLTNDMAGLEVSSGTGIINEIEIEVVPRHVGSAGSVVFTLSDPLSLAPRQMRRLHITFRDDLTRFVGAMNITHYTLTALDETGLINVTSAVSSWLSEITLKGAVLTLSHPYNTSVQVTALTVYGTPLFCESPRITRLVDGMSVTQNGRHRQRWRLPALATLEQADDIARYELSHRKTPRTCATHITLTTQTHAAHVLARTLYERITIAETQTLPTSDYVICAEEHHIAWGTQHEVTWLLEPAETDVFACVGSLLDDAHLVAY